MSPVTRIVQRRIYMVAWVVLAAATLLAILAIDGNRIRWAVGILAWTGGIVSDRLYLSLREDDKKVARRR